MSALDRALEELSHLSPGSVEEARRELEELQEIDRNVANDERELIKRQREIEKLSALLAEKYEIYLQNCAEIDQLKIELEAFFQATVSVLGDDEHRGHTTERVLELCRKTVVAYLAAHPQESK